MPLSRDPGFSFNFPSFFSECLHNERSQRRWTKKAIDPGSEAYREDDKRLGSLVLTTACRSPDRCTLRPPLPAHPGKEKYIIDEQSTGPLIRTDGLFRRECNEKHKKPEHRHPRQNTFQLQGKGTGLSSNARTLHDRLDAPLVHSLVSLPL